MMVQTVARRGVNKTAMIAAVVSMMQLPLLMSGIDLADTGFYMTFYRYIFTYPDSVEYNFMYWLTGIVGGVWLSIFPGIISLRLLAMLCNVGCALFVSRVVGSLGGVVAGAVMVVTGLYGAPSVFNYDHLTALLTVAGLVAAVNGGHKGKALSGALIGISLFARISNAAGIVYIIVAMMYGRRGTRIKSGLIWLAGYGAGVAFCLALMAALGHTGIFYSNLREVAEIAGSSEASHGIGNMLDAQYRAWRHIMVFPLHPTAIMHSNPVVSAAFFALIGLALQMLRGNRRLAVTALLMMAVMPLGSDGGIFNPGTLVLWLALPLAFAACTMPRIDRRLSITLQCLAALLLIIFGACNMTQFVKAGVYFDNTPLTAERDIVDEMDGTGVATGVERAQVINGIVEMVRKNVPENEEILVYGAAPAIYYLTGTRPAMGNSWPEQWTAPALRKHLEEKGPGKYVLIMKINTYGAYFGEPSDDYAQGLIGENVYHSREKSMLVHDYLRRHGYMELASTPPAGLYTAPDRDGDL